MWKRVLGLLIMVFCGITIYVLFNGPELAAWRETLLALFK